MSSTKERSCCAKSNLLSACLHAMAVGAGVVADQDAAGDKAEAYIDAGAKPDLHHASTQVADHRADADVPSASHCLR